MDKFNETSTSPASALGEFSKPVADQPPVTSTGTPQTIAGSAEHAAQLYSAAIKYATAGIKIIPLHYAVGDVCSCEEGDKCGKKRGKHPRFKKWQHVASCDIAMVTYWWTQWPLSNIGMPIPEGVVVLDFDPRNGGDDTARHLEAQYGPFPPTRTQRTGGDGWHMVYSAPRRPDGSLIRIANKSGFKPGLDVLADSGKFIVVEPSIHASGKTYQFIGGFDAPLAPLPAWVIVPSMIKTFPVSVPTNGGSVGGVETFGTNGEVAVFAPPPPPGSPISDGARNAELYRIGCGRREDCGTNEDVLGFLRAYNQEHCKPPLDDREVRVIACSVCTKPIGDGSFWARKASANVEALVVAARSTGGFGGASGAGTNGRVAAPSAAAPPSDNDTIKGFEYNRTDLGNAELLVALHGDTIRYCHQLNSWLCFNGVRWAPDAGAEVSYLANRAMRKRVRDAAEITTASEVKAEVRHALVSENASKRKGCLDQAATLPAAQVVQDVLDVDPWLLNVLNGTLDLRSGELRPHCKGDMITKVAPVAFDPAATCSLWFKFMERIMNGNLDLMRFLQRWAGYNLTGSTQEECMALFFGGGRNGKGTFTETLASLLGQDYTYKVPIELLQADTRRSGGGATPDLVKLRGVRFAYASETEEAKRLAEALIKDTTGGDTISARALYKDPINFKPTHKLTMACNHKPVVRSIDEGIWSRIHLVPFTVEIPLEERDRRLKVKLREELSGILNWALNGCLAWQADGLKPPKEVIEATHEYRNDSDTFSDFLNECCIMQPGVRDKASSIYAVYASWCSRSGESAVSSKTFAERLKSHGFEPCKGSKGVREWLGLVTKDLSVFIPPATR